MTFFFLLDFKSIFPLNIDEHEIHSCPRDPAPPLSRLRPANGAINQKNLTEKISLTLLTEGMFSDNLIFKQYKKQSRGREE
ncbi:hypothetical protein BpJC7_09560 [Weizmannia acidilactici]|uniref:Uncharacterized protein n=1 Tax=Weizmannia acidilactici TaxID=2607726 RepID=A0A5J4JCF7_9BACI|nr:hypothetical protein [Weizmannia acidilactici]GER67143.1 hypothetical protein BpJC4_16140 [Weizmannia acidilactici]GER69653.1 hypothetical protein BpJC7_09560 [Weizmannia acidilactici]